MKPITVNEKIAAYGINSVSLDDAIALVLGCHKSEAATLLRIFRNESPLAITKERLKREQLTTESIPKTLALFYLIDKASVPSGLIIRNADDVIPALYYIAGEPQENFVLITLNGSGQIIKRRTITIGTLNQTLVHPREVFAPAIEDRAATIIIAHNHPSGSPTPSLEDIRFTKRIQEASNIIGIDLVDHIIITPKLEKYSFKENNQM